MKGSDKTDSALDFWDVPNVATSDFYIKDVHKISERKSNRRMKLEIIFVIILAVFVTASNASRFGGKGNLRGVATKFSSLSPQQMILFKKLIRQRQKRKYGRFA